MLQQPVALLLKSLCAEGQVGHHGIAVEVMAAPMFLGVDNGFMGGITYDCC